MLTSLASCSKVGTQIQPTSRSTSDPHAPRETGQGRTEFSVSLAELLEHQWLSDELGVLHVGLQPALGKGHIGAAPVVAPHVDAGVVDGAQVVVGQEVLGRGQGPAVSVVHRVHAAQGGQQASGPGLKLEWHDRLRCLGGGFMAPAGVGQLGMLSSLQLQGAGQQACRPADICRMQLRLAALCLKLEDVTAGCSSQAQAEADIGGHRLGHRLWGVNKGVLVALAVGCLEVALLAHSHQGAGEALDVGGHVGDPGLVVGSCAAGALAAALVDPATCQVQGLDSDCMSMELQL